MISIISSGLNIMVPVLLSVMFSMALFHVNFNFKNRVLLAPLSNSLTMANPEI